MQVLLIISFLFSVISLSKQTESHYTVVTESQLRPNSKFCVHTTVYNGDEPVQLTASLTSKSNQSISFSTDALIDTTPNGQLLEIEIPSLPIEVSSFKLSVVGEGGANFTHEETIWVQKPNKYHIEVTVDKDIYNVGDIVKLNALIVDNRMKAIADGELVNVTVYNEYNVIIKEWINIPTKRGFVWEEVLLNDKCHRGEHRIQVNYENAIGIRRFYVPDETNNQLFFDIDIEMPVDIKSNGSNTIVKGLIKTSYKHGRDLHGILDLEVKNDNLLQCILSFKCKTIHVFKGVPISGKKYFSFNTADLGFFVNQVTVKARVTDNLTGRVRSISKRQLLNKFKNSNIKLGINHQFFVPQMPLKFYIDYNNKSVSDLSNRNGTNITLTVTFQLNDRANVSKHFTRQKFNYTLFPNDRVYISVVPPEFTDRVILQIKKNKTILQNFNLEKSPYNTRSHELSIVVDDVKIQVGNNVTADIYTTGNIDFLSYDVIALRSKRILQAGNLLISGKGPHRIEFPVLDEAVTYFHLLVYGSTNDGILVADQRLFNTRELHPFKMNLKVEPSNPYPGSEVNITIESKPNTFVFLKAADSVVKDKLQQLNNKVFLTSWDEKWHEKVEATNLFFKEAQFAASAAIGFFSNRKQLFQYLSLKLHTNAEDFVDDSLQDPIYRTPPSTELLNALKKPRTDFSTLWLWKNYSLGEDGKITFTTKAPDKISMWETQLYGVNNRHDISVFQGPKITITKPLFAFIDLPPTLIRGEAILMRVIVFQDSFNPVNVTVFSQNQRFQILHEASHKVLSNNNLTKEVQGTEDGLGFAVSFLLSPLYTGPIEVRVIVTSESGEEDVVIQTIRVKESSNKLHPVVYEAKDAARFGEEACNQPTVKSSYDAIDLNSKQEKLNISFQVNSMNDEEGNLRVNACVKYTHKEEADIILEIDLPSGFEFSSPLIDETNATNLSNEYELVNNNNRLRWYFKEVPNQLICLSVMAERVFTVYNLQPAKVTAYTSFNLQTAKRARVYYRAPSFEII